MEIRLLEYFLAVCEELHFTRAAEKLGVSQPTLSQQIRILESRIGAKLFHRIGRKTYLTDAGEILKKRANNIFIELDEAIKEIQDTNNLQIGNITIGSVGNNLVYLPITSFHSEFPNVNISVVDTTTSEIVKNIVDNTFDLGIVFLPITNDQVHDHKIFTSELYAVCSKEHELSSLPSISLDQISQQRVFLLHKKFLTRKIIDDYCHENGIKLTANVELSDMNSLLDFIRSNDGITILPQVHLEHADLSGVRKIPISDPIPKKDIGVIYRKNSYLPSAVRAFLTHLFKCYRVK